MLATLVDSGAELILAGHIHQAAVSERREFEVTHGDVRAVVVSIAPGLGQPRPNRRGEARGLHVYEIDEAPSRSRRTSGATTTGGSRRCGASHGAVSPSKSTRCARARSLHGRP